METKKLEILVIEDTPEFLAKAKEVYGSEDRINATYVTNYEDAIHKLKSGRHNGVISDLFFPSQVNWREKFVSEMVCPDEYNRDTFGEIKEEFEALSENPSGLGILSYCLEQNLPLVMLSQGERHHGNLATVRYAVKFIPEFVRGYGKDPFDSILLYSGILGEESQKERRDYNLNKSRYEVLAIDKSKVLTWKDAVYATYTGLLTRMESRQR